MQAMVNTEPGKRRDGEMDLSTLRLERRRDGQLWLKRDGEDDPWYAAAIDGLKPPTDGTVARDGENVDAGSENVSVDGDTAANDGDADKSVAKDKAAGVNGKGKKDAGGVDERGVAVRIAPCFPWSRAGRYISVRTGGDKEIALIRRLDELADETRRLVEQALAEIGFVLEVTRVVSIDTEVEVRNWKVETRQGPFTFQTKLDEWPDPLEDGNLVLRDVAGNLFLIPDPSTLDAQSRKLLWPFVG